MNLNSNYSSWKDYYSYLCNLENDKNFSKAGLEFETFAKGYFLNTELFKNVYLYNEIPSKEKQRFNLSDRDHGVDLLLIDHTNQGFGVQVKFRVDQDQCVSWSKDKLSNLIAHRSLDGHILFSNASFVDKETEKQGKNFQKILYGDLIDLSKDDWSNIRDLLNHKPVKHSKYQPHEYQRTIISDVAKGFANHNRGKLILPCGAGKTLVSLWIKENLNPKRTLVLVPSLALLRQFKNEWLRHRNYNFDYACICSEQDIDKDETKTSISELGFVGLGVTTEPFQIKEWLKKDSLVIFSTYQSSPMIKKALANTNLQFDLIICDEAHRTATNKASSFTIVHDNNNIKASKRLYMTATPRILGQQVINKHGEEIKKYVADMSNEEIYGPEFYRMSFKEAIEKNILVDYKIIAMGVTDSDLHQKIKTRRYTDQNEMDMEDLANQVALEKVMEKYGIHHAITFHSSVKRAKDFQEYHQEQYAQTTSFHVNGTQTTSQRQTIINEFKEAEKSVLTNARCLTEGVDVPSIDCVYFCDPKNSKIDIVQACGRALRLNVVRSKKLGYIVCPIYHHDDEDVDAALERGAYSNTISVLRAMNDHDSRLEEEIQKIVYGKGARSKSNQHIFISTEQSPLILDGFKLTEELNQKIFSTIVRKSLIPWKPFEEARQFAHSLQLKSKNEWEQYTKSGKNPDDVPFIPAAVYKNKGWVGWGDWLGTGTIASFNKIYRSFEEARQFAHSLQLKSKNEWEQYTKSGKNPDDVPFIPAAVYKNKGWVGWGDWLGTGTIASFNKIYRSFEEARQFAHSLQLKSKNEWGQYAKSGKKPDDIPASPARAYQNKGWVGWGDWLGTGAIANQNRVYQQFKESRKFVHSLQLKSKNEWGQYAKSGKKPDDIPASPARAYQNKGWVGWGDWLGTGAIASFNKIYRSFEEARQFVHSLQLKNRDEWVQYTKSEKKPDDIPADPAGAYKNKGWIGMGDWLGTGSIANQNRVYRQFEEARQFAHSLKLKNQKEWFQFSKSGKKPDDIPASPARAYQNKGWVGWGDWLGTGAIASFNKIYRSFEEARQFVHSLQLKSKNEWGQYTKSGKKPDDIPAHPTDVYKNKGWVGWGDWLGTGTIASFNKIYRSFEQARQFVHSLQLKNRDEWGQYTKSGKKPDDIPASPTDVYKNKGWVGWGDWLGKKK
jgi:superfamily II DNA or RNA helicase/transcriptional regulator NrdR family protein